MRLSSAYSKALLDYSNETAIKPASLLKDLLSMQQALESSSAMRAALLSPLFGETELLAAVQAVAKKLKCTEAAIRFFGLLCAKRRWSAFSEIVRDFRQRVVESDGGLLGALVSADPMNAQEIEGLSKMFSKHIGKKVEFDVRVDPALLAGVVATVQGVTYNGSLQSQFNKLKEQFIHGNA